MPLQLARCSRAPDLQRSVRFRALLTSDGNRKSKIWYTYQENIKTKLVFGISLPNFLVFSGYFIGTLRTILLKFGYILVFLGQNKNMLGIWYLWLVWFRCHFLENDISTAGGLDFCT